jgi:NADH-quinone oxidoreductase subunit C
MSEKIEKFSSEIESKFGSKVEVELSFDEIAITVLPENLLEVCQSLKDDFGFEILVDLCGVDYSTYGQSDWETEQTSSTGFSRGVEQRDEGGAKWSGKRFASVIHLLSVSNNLRIRVKSFCQDDEVPRVPSVVDIWNGVNWFERESFDLFGILYDGHPDLRRILTDYGFVGHPFRKDFPLIGEVEMRYDAKTERCVYEPVSIEPRVLVPRVIREDGRFDSEESKEGTENG